MPMRFTKYGYLGDDGATVSATVRYDGERASYGLAEVPAEEVLQCGAAAYRKPCPLPTPHDVVSTLYNIALGQRATTPTFMDVFLDRYSKTFFREGIMFSFLLQQEAVTNASALANYYHMNRWNPKSGVISRLADEYRFVEGNYAKMLFDSLHGKTTCAEDTELHEDGRKCRIAHVPFPDGAAGEIAGAVPEMSDAVAVVEGAMIACCWNDHTATVKDMNNKSVRSALDIFKPMVDRVGFADGGAGFATRDSFEALKEMAANVDMQWTISPDGDRLFDAFVPADAGGGER